MTQEFDVCTFGSVTLDLFLEGDEIDTQGDFFSFSVGDKIKLRSVNKFVGGGAANCGAGFAKLGLKTAIFGVIADDDEGKFIEKTLAKSNICTDYLTREKGGSSSFSVILNAKDGRRTVFHHRSTDKGFGAQALKNAPQTRAIYVGHLYHEGESLFDEISSFKGIMAWNPGKTQFESGFDKFTNIFPHVNALILNVEEAELFTGLKSEKILFDDFKGKQVCSGIKTKKVADVRLMADKFLAAGVKNVVITDGSRGSQLFNADGHYYVPASDEKPVSTLGAGDAFSTGFVAGILHGKDPSEAMCWGSASSESVIKCFGAQNGLLGLEGMEKGVKSL